MNKQIVFSVIFLTLLLTFQNCSPPLLSQNNADGLGNKLVDQVPMNQTPAPPVEFLEVVSAPGLDSGSQKVLAGNLLIDLTNGEVSSLDHSGNPTSGPRYCLQSEELGLVNAILRHSQ